MRYGLYYPIVLFRFHGYKSETQAPVMANKESSMIPNLLFSGSAQSSFACEQCKKKKVKCDKSAPICGHCQRHKRSCNYPHSVSRPGPKAGISRRRRHLSTESVVDDEFDQKTQNAGSHGSNADKQYERAIAIIHPHHHSPSILPHAEQHEAGQSTGECLGEALRDLRISDEQCQRIISTYFSNMTSFSLFHQPTFWRKLSAMRSSKGIQALLVAMAAFSNHFESCGIPAIGQGARLWERAHTLVRDSLDDVADETPPLELLQALLLVTWQRTYQGVRGVAFRLIGQCVRLAYEMKLNAEPDGSNGERWIQHEESRRAWWMCWELDIFASTIRRLPTAIDWASNNVLLPIQDSAWFSGTKVQSCALELDLNERWKAIQRTNNRSWTAWFAVINSYKYDAYILSMPATATGGTSGLNGRTRGIPPTSISKATPGPTGRPRSTSLGNEKHREVLRNCLHCLLIGLPEELTVGNTFLSFSPDTRHNDHGRYAIHLLLQVTRFFLFRQDIFRALPVKARRLARETATTPEVQSSTLSPTSSGSHTVRESRITSQLGDSTWRQFLATAEDTSMLIRNSPRHHIQFVNPCLSNAIWFAASALIIGKLLEPSQNDADREWMTSNFDLLWTTLRQYIKIWNVPATLVDRFSTLEDYISSLGTTRNRKQSFEQAQHMQTKPDSNKPAAKKKRVDSRDVSQPYDLSAQSIFSSGTEAQEALGSTRIQNVPQISHMQLHAVDEICELSQHVPTPASSEPGSLVTDVENTLLAGETHTNPADDVKPSHGNGQGIDIMQDIDINDLLNVSADIGLDFDFFRCPFE